MFTLHYFTFHMPFTPKVTSGASTKLCMSGIVCIPDKGKGDALTYRGKKLLNHVIP